jgi:cyanophycinase
LPASPNTSGSIFAIGGREDRVGAKDLLHRFVEICGAHEARIVVLSTASREPIERLAEYRAAFEAIGVAEVACFHQEERAEANDPKLLAAIDAADGIFMTGGNQLKLVTTLAGSDLEKRLRERHVSGLHLAGTSAGASALSAVMIARGKARSAARLSSLRMSPGLAILPGIIVDQHFRERDRIGRLIAAILCNPGMLGFGLDEDTAFELDAQNQVRVMGKGTLTIVDASRLAATDIGRIPEDSPAAFAGLQLHALSAGWTFDTVTRQVGPPPDLVDESSAPSEPDSA